MTLKEIFAEVIKKLYDIENCDGNWKKECHNIPSVKCQDCCEGVALLLQLALVNDQKIL